MAVTATVVKQWNDGKELNVLGTLAFTGNYAIGGDTIDFGAAGVESQQPPTSFECTNDYGWMFIFVPGSLATNGRLITLLLSAQAATGTITSSGVNVTDGDTVTLGATTYTFKNNITAQNHVQIGATAAASLQNLADAINKNPVTSGTAYFSTTNPNATEFAAPPTATVLTVVCRKAGVGGNGDGLSKVAATLTVSGANLASGAAVSVNPGELPAGAYPADLAVIQIPFVATFDMI